MKNYKEADREDFKEAIRVKASTEIKEKLSELIRREKDIFTRKKHPARWYREKVAELLGLKEEENCSIRTYEDLMSKIKDNIRSEDDDINKPWTIGSCFKYNIPASMVPTLIKIQRFGLKPTIRDVRWFTLLSPLVEEIVGKNGPQFSNVMNTVFRVYLKIFSQDVENSPDQLLKITANEPINKELQDWINSLSPHTSLLVMLGLLYSAQERISESTGEIYPNTNKLDTRYFIKGDITVNSLFDAVSMIQLSSLSDQIKKGFSKAQMEKAYGKELTDEQVNKLNESMRAALDGSLSSWDINNPVIAN
jgi:hypothetical protein